MQYSRCKCGIIEWWDSGYPSPKCQGCPVCHTTIEYHPDLHKVPEPHTWVVRYDEYSGESYNLCDSCHEKEAHIKKKNQIILEQHKQG